MLILDEYRVLDRNQWNFFCLMSNEEKLFYIKYKND